MDSLFCFKSTALCQSMDTYLVFLWVIHYVSFSCFRDGAACDGICVLEYISLTFLIYDPDAKTMVFDQFLLPGYCSCKRVLY